MANSAEVTEVRNVLAVYKEEWRAIRSTDRMRAVLRRLKLTGRYGVRKQYARGLWRVVLVDRNDTPETDTQRRMLEALRDHFEAERMDRRSA